MKNFRRNMASHWRAILVTTVIVLIIDVVMYLLLALVIWKEDMGPIRAAADAGTLIGGFTLGSGLLLLLGHYGAYDTFSYGVSTLLTMHKNKKRYQDLIDYRDRKTAKRENAAPWWFPFITIGSVITLVGIIFDIVFFTKR